MSIHSIMTQDKTGKELVEFAQQTALKLVKDNLRTAQIRTVFTEVRQIEAEWQNPNLKEKAIRRLMMLKPKLYYQAERQPAVNHLRDVLSAAIDEVENAPLENRDEAFQRFIDFFEAILAYHKAKGGRN